MKHWIAAFRLRTLPLALSSIIFGSALAIKANSFKPAIFISCIVTTVLLQILSNLANDYGDFQKGTDNDKRVGPDRALQSGNISITQMKKAIIFFSFLSFASGLLLLFFSFNLENLHYVLAFLLLGLASIWAAINYTAGKSAYGYRALGDIFVFIFFGLVGVLGSCFLFTKSFQVIDILPASACGLFAVGVLNLNNTRDIENDKISNKITIPVIIGLKWAKIYQAVLLELAYWLLFLYAYFVGIKAVYLSLLTLPITIHVILVLKKVEGKEIDPLLKKVAISSFITSLLFLAGMFM